MSAFPLALAIPVAAIWILAASALIGLSREVWRSLMEGPNEGMGCFAVAIWVVTGGLGLSMAMAVGYAAARYLGFLG